MNAETHVRKKKIGLFLGARPIDGGLYQYSLAMLRAVQMLPAQDFDVVACYQFDSWAAETQRLGLTSFQAPNSFFSKAVRRLWKQAHLDISLWRQIAPIVHSMSRRLIKEQCDLWIFPSQDEWTYYVPVNALGVVHDLMHRYERRFPEVSADGEFERRERHYKALCKWSKAILTDSETGRRQVHESYGVPLEKTYALPYIAPDYITHNPHTQNQSSRSQISPNRKYFFYPAQFWEHKNHRTLLRAIAILKKTFPDVFVVFVGSKKNAYDAIVSLVAELKLEENTTILGYVENSEMAELYKNARALVMPTFFGPTNIPPLEAFALGCPSAVSKIYGMPEQVGSAALMFDPTSEHDIAQTLEKLWTDDHLCKQLREAGLKKSREWTQTDFSTRLESIIKQVLLK